MLTGTGLILKAVGQSWLWDSMKVLLVLVDLIVVVAVTALLITHAKKYIRKKVVWFVVTFICAILLNFMLPRLMPGDPLGSYLQTQLTGVTDPVLIQQKRDDAKRTLGLDKHNFGKIGDYIGFFFDGTLFKGAANTEIVNYYGEKQHVLLYASELTRVAIPDGVSIALDAESLPEDMTGIKTKTVNEKETYLLPVSGTLITVKSVNNKNVYSIDGKEIATGRMVDKEGNSLNINAGTYIFIDGKQVRLSRVTAKYQGKDSLGQYGNEFYYNENGADTTIYGLTIGEDGTVSSFVTAREIDNSVLGQFGDFIKNVCNGTFGRSISSTDTRFVSEIISEGIVWTIILQLPAILCGWWIGNKLGAKAAYKRGFRDKVLMPTTLFMSALPAFGAAICLLLLMYTLNKTFGWSIPLSKSYDPAFTTWSWPWLWSVITRYVAPFLSIVLISIGGQAVGMRSMSIYELNADYVKYSRFMGIKDKKITKYVFRNAMLPQVTGLAMSIGGMVGGALVAETIFSYNGLGTTMFSAISSRNFPVISGITLIITVMVLLAAFLLDIIYALIDPRVKAAQFD